MEITWTETQKQRLSELDAAEGVEEQRFSSTQEREQAFHKLEKELVSKNKELLLKLRDTTRRPLLSLVKERLVNRLTEEGFVQVVTPILLSRGMLNRMTITPDHPLNKQVFWVDQDKCLRPMLAPNLYHLLRELLRVWGKPVRIFEVGPCFRKESEGSQHLNEFTMLNLVELGDFEGQQEERLREMAVIAMDAVGITDYRLEKDSCHVYGNTVDVVAGDMELGSGAWGPHKLDEQWGIIDPWVGLGIGLERLAVTIRGHRNIKRVGRSLSYLDGARLNI